MAYSVTITYVAANDIFNIKKQSSNIVSAAPIPGVTANEMPGEYQGPSKPYLYAADNATAPQYLKENLVNNSDLSDAGLSLLTSSQLRWPKSVTNSIINILEAYRTPQIPVYRAWQTFKMAIEGGSNTFEVPSMAEASFYEEAGKALTKYGFAVTYELVTEGGEG